MPLLSLDASQLEWRTAVELSHDETGLAELMSGEDIHSINQKTFNLGDGKPGRLLAKIYLFRTIFRGSGWSFANDNDFSHFSASAKFWDGINEQFYKKYSGLDRQHQSWSEDVLRGKPIVGPLGREWLIPIRYEAGREFKIPWTLLSNYPVQGTGADVMSIVRISLFNRLKKLGIPCKFISTVHDSVVMDVPSEYIQTIANVCYDVFDDLQLNIKRIFKYEWVTPLACEVSTGPNMKQMIEVKRT